MKRKKLIIIGVVILTALLLAAAIICGVIISDQSDTVEIVQPSASTSPAPTGAIPVLSGDTSVSTPTPSSPTIEPQIPKESDTPTSTATTKPSPALFCTLTILGSKIEVYDSVDESCLKKRPGWLASSAAPGEDGMCVIYGHRNRRHLRVLEKISIGDEIAVTMTDGTKYVYTVSETIVFESTDEMSLPTVNNASLALVTCYPFHYTGNAPGKFVCLSSEKSRDIS